MWVVVRPKIVILFVTAGRDDVATGTTITRAKMSGAFDVAIQRVNTGNRYNVGRGISAADFFRLHSPRSTPRNFAPTVLVRITAFQEIGLLVNAEPRPSAWCLVGLKPSLVTCTFSILARAYWRGVAARRCSAWSTQRPARGKSSVTPHVVWRPASPRLPACFTAASKVATEARWNHP